MHKRSDISTICILISFNREIMTDILQKKKVTHVSYIIPKMSVTIN